MQAKADTHRNASNPTPTLLQSSPLSDTMLASRTRTSGFSEKTSGDSFLTVAIMLVRPGNATPDSGAARIRAETDRSPVYRAGRTSERVSIDMVLETDIGWAASLVSTVTFSSNVSAACWMWCISHRRVSLRVRMQCAELSHAEFGPARVISPPSVLFPSAQVQQKPCKLAARVVSAEYRPHHAHLHSVATVLQFLFKERGRKKSCPGHKATAAGIRSFLMRLLHTWL
jgi:hypothetical protein